MLPSSPEFNLYASALRAVKIYARLFPPKYIPIPYLQELVAEDYPVSQTDLIESLFHNGKGFLVRENDSAEVAQINENPDPKSAVLAKASEIAELKKKLRAFHQRKLDESNTEKTQRINRVMTGDPLLEVTAWTVPSIDVAKARAAEDDHIQIIDYGDGSYSVKVKPTSTWEGECFAAYVQQEFNSDDLEGILFALGTGFLSAGVLRDAKTRLGELHLQKPDNLQAAIVTARFWLTLAHKSYGDGGSARGSWGYACIAVEILEAAKNKYPNDTTIVELLPKALEARWSYDD